MSTNTQVVQECNSLSIDTNISTIGYLERLSLFINKFLALLAGYGLLLMVVLIVGNGLLRVIYKPFSGTTEVVGWLCALSSAFGLGYTQINRGYVDIDALVQHFSSKVQHLLKSIILLISTMFFTLVTWQIVLYGINTAQNGNLSETMGITFYPLIILVAIGFAGLSLALLVDFLKQLFTGRC